MPWNSCSFISLFQYKYNSNYSNEINNQLYHFRQITNGKVYKKLANRMSKNDPFNFYLFGKMRICFSSKCMPKIHTQNCLSFVIVVSYAESERARALVCVRVSFGWLSDCLLLLMSSRFIMFLWKYFSELGGNTCMANSN